MRRWYVAETKHNAEWLACNQLLAQGFDVCLPTMFVAGRVVLMFPHYVLVRFDATARGVRWRSINGTRGVKALLWGEDPAPLPRDVGEALYLRSPLYDPTAPERRAKTWSPGDRVKAVAGLFVSQCGTVVRSAGDRVKVLIALLGREVEVDIHTEDIARVIG